MILKYKFLLAIFFSLLAVNAHAEDKSDFLKKRRGLITSSTCPFDCRNLNLSSNLCKQWRSGDTCYVEDFTQVPGHRSMIRIPNSAFIGVDGERGTETQRPSQPRGRLKSTPVGKARRGLVTSAQCPYTCRSAGVPKNMCREWKDSMKCFVEDFTQVPGHRSLIRVPLSAFSS